MLLFVSLIYQCFADLIRFLFKNIRQIKNNVSTGTSNLYSFQPHIYPLDSVFTKECVFLNYNYGTQQTLLSKYIDFNFHPTYIILDLNFTRAIGSHYAIIYYDFYLYIYILFFKNNI